MSGVALPTAADVDLAWAVVRAQLPPTPVRVVDGVLAKCEFEAPTGSFKVRGALAALSRAAGSGARAVVAASAGNHGAGVAWAAGRAGVEATIVVPRDCPPVKLDKMRRLGALVRVSEHAGYDAAESEALALAAALGVPFVSPFLDRDVMAGNGGTLARELVAQVPGLASVVVPVGGGGLLSGLLLELQRLAPEVRVAAVQSEACPSFVRSLADGCVYERWEGAATVAEGLEGGTGAPGVELALRYGVRALTVPEAEIVAAMRRVWRASRVSVEGSAAVVLAARAMGMLDPLPEPCAHVLTGGNVDPGQIGA